MRTGDAYTDGSGNTVTMEGGSHKVFDTTVARDSSGQDMFHLLEDMFHLLEFIITTAGG